MFYNLIYKLFVDSYSFLNILKYVSFRSICAFLVTFLLVLVTGNKFIKFVKYHQKTGQPIREDGPETHLLTKSGTPTMGGALVIASVTIGSFLFIDLTNINAWMCLSVFIGFGFIGAIDDYKKVKKHDYHGLSGKKKFFMQILVATVCWYVFTAVANNSVQDFSINTSIFFPILKNFQLDLGYFFIAWVLLIIVGSSNAVNLTDGLDGLAMGPVIMSSISFAVISYLAGNIIFADYLKIQYIPGMSEVCVFLGSLVGACLGFTWFNAPPAKIFMGDTGSVAIGGVLGFTAVMSKHEFIYALIGGVFVLETMSVIIQVLYFKLTGKRIFLMAPIHHHFEKKGWSESTVVFRFWIISIVLSIIGLATLKIR